MHPCSLSHAPSGPFLFPQEGYDMIRGYITMAYSVNEAAESHRMRKGSHFVERSLTTTLGGLFVVVLCAGLQAADSDAYGPDAYRTGRVYDTADNPFMVLDPKNNTLKYGDPFPVYFDGVWHLYTLQSGLGCVRHLTSRDLVTWIEHQPALTGGGIATGVVLRHEGTYYMFYTLGQMGIGLVTSDNPWHFDRKKSKTVAAPDPEFYPGAKPFRDVSVFYHEQEQRWWMLLEAHVKDKGVQVALLKAEQLEGPWKPLPALYTQPRNADKSNRFVSCPQIIRQGDTWYLTYLSHATWYHAAANPSGPWGERKGQYNSDFLTAGSRSASDGRRRLNWGFFSVRPTPENPGARARYGGPLGVGRELVFFDDHTIGVRPLPELVAAIREPANHVALFSHLEQVSGDWRFDAEKQIVSSLGVEGGVAAIDLPDAHPDYYFETNLEFGENVAAASVTVRASDEPDCGYRVAMLPKEGIFEITEPAGQRREYLSEPHQFAGTARLKIFVCDGQLEAFVDGRSDLSTRVLNKSGSKIVLESKGGKASFRNPLLHYFNVTHGGTQDATNRPGLSR